MEEGGIRPLSVLMIPKILRVVGLTEEKSPILEISDKNFLEPVIFSDKRRFDFFSSISCIIISLSITCLFNKATNSNKMTHRFSINCQ